MTFPTLSDLRLFSGVTDLERDQGNFGTDQAVQFGGPFQAV